MKKGRKKGANVERPTPNAQYRIGEWRSCQSFEIRCWAFSVRRFLLFNNQVRRDSNPQPTVLETATLPIELLTYRDFRFSIADFRFQENRQLLSFIRQSTFGNLQLSVSPECPRHDRRRRFCRLRESRTGWSSPSRSG